DNTLNGFRGVQGVQGREHQVAGFGGEQGRGDGFQVAHFTDQNHIGVLTKAGTQGGREVGGVDFHFALVDETALVAVQKLDRVFNGNDVIGAVGVDTVNHCRQGGGLARTGGSGDQDQPALFFANFRNDWRKIQLLDGANLGWNDAENHAHVAALLEDVHTKTAKAGDTIGHIQFRGLLELLLLPVGHHAEGHGQHFFRHNTRDVGDGGQQTVDAKIGVVADFQVQV